ncbi:MAG: type II secretion system protein E [Planctomycetota bacterium]|nr:MAG: type II secretion system protein E [Planctomycetota bacterium]
MRGDSFTELGQFEIDPESARQLPLEFCQRYHCCVLGRISPVNRAAAIPVGMLEPDNDEIVREIELKLGRRVRPVQLNAYEIRTAIETAFGLSGEESGALLAPTTLDHLRSFDFRPDAPPSRILDDILAIAIRSRATDIHIETYRKDVDLRLRCDGVLRQLTSPLSPDNVKKVISRIKVLCNLDIAAKPQPLDGRFSARYVDARGQQRLVHFRVSIVPAPHGEDCVIRVLDGAAAIQLSLDRLGMSPSALHAFRTLLHCPSGLILVTGPTGSGKTTTLYAALRELMGETRKICTVEDPIEYELPKVNQKQVDEHNSFADYARAFLRQDPDVLLIGEIRDEETAQIALRAGMTGQLVLATLHTQDAIGTVARLRSLGVDDELLSTVLLGAVSQRLLRLNCRNCIEQYTPRAETLVRFYRDDPGDPFWRGRGCPDCDNTGYFGRLGIFEVFVVDDVVRAAIERHATVEQIRELARERGYVPLVEEALERVRRGHTTVSEVERNVRPLYYV